MEAAYNFIHGLGASLYNGLLQVNHPVLGVSLVVVLFSVLLINLIIWVFHVLSGGNMHESSGGRIDNNNNTIYRR